MKGFKQRKRESKKRGKLRGLGIGSYLEVTAPPNKEMGGIRFEPNGDVTIITGTLDYGQGHAAPFAQVLTERLGVPFERIKLHQGDSDELLAGGGTGGSRSMYASGTAILEGADEVIKKGKQIAGFVLEASAGDIEFGNGRFTIAGTDRSIGIMELAEKLRSGVKLPEGVPNSLSVKHVSNEPIPSVFPNGCHVAEVEVDPDTGVVEIVKYNSVNDFGTIINPLLVAGQVHGGVVQGIGQALMEKTAYDADGQLLTGSYMDYADAARGGLARDRLREPSGSGQDQSARREGLRRGRLRRRADLGDERDRRRALGLRRQEHRDAGDTRARVEHDPGGEGAAHDVTLRTVPIGDDRWCGRATVARIPVHRSGAAIFGRAARASLRTWKGPGRALQ